MIKKQKQPLKLSNKRERKGESTYFAFNCDNTKYHHYSNKRMFTNYATCINIDDDQRFPDCDLLKKRKE